MCLKVWNKNVLKWYWTDYENHEEYCARYMSRSQIFIWLRIKFDQLISANMFSSKKKNATSASSPKSQKKSSKGFGQFLSLSRKSGGSSSSLPAGNRKQSHSTSSTPCFDRKQSNLSINTINSSRQGDSFSQTSSSSHSSLYTPTGSYRFSPNTSTDSAVQLWVRSFKLISSSHICAYQNPWHSVVCFGIFFLIIYYHHWQIYYWIYC